jgi:hypothetical protein
MKYDLSKTDDVLSLFYMELILIMLVHICIIMITNYF